MSQKENRGRKHLPRKVLWLAMALLAASLVLVSCGSSDSEEEDAEEEETAEETEAAEEAEEADEEEEETEEAEADGDSEYVVMNIPYADFYAAELTSNEVEVDIVSSATCDNWSQIFCTTTYSEDGGYTIGGITYPVMTTADALEAIGAEEVESDDLPYSGDYAYYVIDADTYSYYKELTAGEDGSASFGEAVYEEEAVELSDAEVTITTESSYGDYELTLSNIDSSGSIYATIGDSYGDIYAIVITAEDSDGNETDYGLRQMENIWEGGAELAFAVNEETYEDEQYNLLSNEHYASMVGQTITQLTFYTAGGIYIVPAELIVQETSDATITAEDVAQGTSGITVTIADLEEDFEPAFAVEGESVDATDNGDGTYTLPYEADTIGTITVTVSDSSGLYADVNAYFTVTTDTVYAVYDEAAGALVAADGISEEDFEAYLALIDSVSVDGTSYETEGRSGVVIINEDGTVNTEAEGWVGHGPDAEGFSIFESGNSYAIVVSVTGYPDVSFTYTME